MFDPFYSRTDISPLDFSAVNGITNDKSLTKNTWTGKHPQAVPLLAVLAAYGGSLLTGGLGGGSAATGGTSGGGMGFGGAGTGGLPSNLAGSFANTSVGANTAAEQLAAAHGIAGGAGIGSATGGGAAGLGASDYIKLGSSLANQAGPAQQPDLGAQANAQVRPYPTTPPTMSERFQSGLGTLTNAMAPVDPRVAAMSDPNYIKALQNKAMLQTGLGILASASKGNRFGTAVGQGYGLGQQSLDSDMQDAYRRGVVDREYQRQQTNDTQADQRYDANEAYRKSRDSQSDTQWQQQFKATQDYHDKMLKIQQEHYAAMGGGTSAKATQDAIAAYDDPQTRRRAAYMVMVNPDRMREFASYGTAGQAIRGKVESEITQIQKETGMTDAEIAAMRASARANVKNQQTLTSQAAQYSALEKVAHFNGDRIMALLNKVSDTNVPIAEGVTRAVKRGVMGSDDALELNSVFETFRMEVSRVLAGHPELKGQISDTLRKDIENMAPSNMTPSQGKRIINRLYAELGVRSEGVAEQIDRASGAQAPQLQNNVIDFGGGGLGGSNQPFQIQPGQHGGPEDLMVDY